MTVALAVESRQVKAPMLISVGLASVTVGVLAQPKRPQRRPGTVPVTALRTPLMLSVTAELTSATAAAPRAVRGPAVVAVRRVAIYGRELSVDEEGERKGGKEDERR